MIYICITEGGPGSWAVEVCTDFWDTMESRLVFGSYSDAVNAGELMEKNWKWMEG